MTEGIDKEPGLLWIVKSQLPKWRSSPGSPHTLQIQLSKANSLNQSAHSEVAELFPPQTLFLFKMVL